MGSWGPGPFDNDDASDWLHELACCPDDSVLREAFEPVLLGSADAIDSRLAVAAATVVAARCPHADPDIPEEVCEWRHKHPHLDPALLALARQVLELLIDHSELLCVPVGGDPDAPRQWRAAVRALLAQL